MTTWYCGRMITMDDAQLKSYERTLRRLLRRGLPFATKATINKAAFESRKLTQQNIGTTLIERNKFTRNSLRVEKATTNKISKQKAVMGSIAPYFDTIEFGGSETARGKHGVPIPTTVASGEGEGVVPRTRVPRSANKLRNIKLRHSKLTIRGRNARKQRNIVAVKEAVRTRRRFAFIDTGRRQAIVKVMGGARNPRVKTVWDLTHKSVVIPPHPTMAPAVRFTRKLMPHLYKKELLFQLKRAGMI